MLHLIKVSEKIAKMMLLIVYPNVKVISLLFIYNLNTSPISFLLALNNHCIMEDTSLINWGSIIIGL